MFLTQSVLNSINQALYRVTGHSHTAQILEAVQGGSINRCYKLKYGKHCFFVKLNSTVSLPDLFEAESKGLNTLQRATSLKIPTVLGAGNVGKEQYLLLEWIEPGKVSFKSFEKLAEGLAEMHSQSADRFGLNYSNYMGALAQYNELKNTWTEFFITQRLLPQLRLANSRGLLMPSLISQFEDLIKLLPNLADERPPSLVHGDFWRGNYIINSDGSAVVIDPAISFSNREVDLAMSKLFGGFDERFYSAYHACFPLDNDWEHRLPLWNLYPLLVHLNLFGASYLPQIKTSLKRFL
ncbi:fructosamine kinase family protein [Empedobacter sp. UBA5528]|uniref:fructosamine kinase family protein n=1 Tax=Empedobacter sp. UBA5528 TaxID=1946440 RepID=UPI0025C20B32|nr:fructosamine kinase family protein [Empedobacter sp. UBA5528]